MASTTINVAAVAALLMVLVAAEASIYRTTVTTFETNDSESQQQCRRQMKGQRMEACQSFLQSGGQFSVLMLGDASQDVPRECCDQLKNVDMECRCEMIKKMWEEMQEREQQHGQQKEQSQEQMRKKAQFLPAMCGMEPQFCRISQTSL